MSLYKYPKYTKEVFEELWNNGVIVFDTSAICSLYNLSDYHRNIVIDILTHFYRRLWLPYQVKYEYDRNRIKAINNPISEKYKIPNFIHSTFVKDVRKQIELWKSNIYYHPYMENDKIEELSDLVEKANTLIRKIKDIVNSVYDNRKEEIKNLKDCDKLKEFIDTITCSTPLNYQSIIEIIKEGEFRYRNELPPGYLDSRTINGQHPKEGIRKYGDLIIWKDIISYASKNHKDIILIIDDKKADWYDQDEFKGLPRIELLTEFEEKTGNKIWFYTIQQFIEELEKHYKEDNDTLPLFDKLESVKIVLSRLAKEMSNKHHCEKMIIECNKCQKHFTIWSDCLEWEHAAYNERGMGPEITWDAKSDIDCPNCKSLINIYSTIIEYPQGAIDYENTECNGAEIISSWCLENVLYPKSEDDESENIESCIHCGEIAVLNDMGLCSECIKEMAMKINSEE